MKRLAFGLLLLAACGPAEHPHAVMMREGTTVRTSCADDIPELYEGSVDVTKPYNTRIDRICYYGASNDTRAKVDGALGFTIGDKLTEAAVRPAMDKIMATKLVDNVSIGAEQRGDGVVVYVSVHELPRVDEVIFDGEKISPPPFTAGSTVNPRALAAAATKIKDEYVAKGYGDAKADFTTEPTMPGHVRVRCAVVPGPQWKVKKTAFAGIAKVNDADLRHAIAIEDGSVYDQDVIDIAEMRMIDVYYNHGLINAKVSGPEREVAADGGVTLTWKVDEGDAYTVSAVRFGKISPKLQKQMAAVITTKPKSVFDRAKIVSDAQAATAVYARSGKKASIAPAIKVDDKKKTIDLTFDVVEGS